MWGRKVSQTLPLSTSINEESRRNTRSSYLPSIPAITIYAFGLAAFADGITHLLWPSDALISLHLPAIALPVAKANALANIAMGFFYVLAAYQENRSFFQLTVGVRLLSATVFWRGTGSWKRAAIWDLSGAAITAAALIWEVWLLEWVKEKLGFGEEKMT